jgi:regulator of nucleoside diphosphate kinase
VTMKSQVRPLDIDSGEILIHTPVFPSQARSENALSVLAPIGTAILGYQVGSVMGWQVHRGIRRLKVLEALSTRVGGPHTW